MELRHLVFYFFYPPDILAGRDKQAFASIRSVGMFGASVHSFAVRVIPPKALA